MESGGPSALPTKQDEEFRPFIRRLPEFKFWHNSTRAIGLSILASFVGACDIPVFWPVLVVYWIVLFTLTSKFFLDLEGGGDDSACRRGTIPSKLRVTTNTFP